MTTTMHEKFDVLLETEGDHECEGLGKDKVCVRVVAMAELRSCSGTQFDPTVVEAFARVLEREMAAAAETSAVRAVPAA